MSRHNGHSGKIARLGWYLMLAAILILPMVAGVMMPQPAAADATPVRSLPDTVSPGQTFDVTVTFTSPANGFNTIGLTDMAPAGWTVAVDPSWGTPTPQYRFAKATSNKAEIIQFAQGGFTNGTAFTAIYHVTVPAGAAPGTYTFPGGMLEYRINGSNPAITVPITGDSQMQVNGEAQHYTLTTSVDPTPSGNTIGLSPTQPAGGYDSGTPVTLTPNPATGYVFDHWSGDVLPGYPNIYNNPLTITMDANKNLTAHFIPETPGVTVTVNAPARVPTNYDFTVSLDISEVTNFDADNFDVTFNSAVLRLDNVTSGLIGSTVIPVDVYNQISPGRFSVVQNVPGLAGVTGSGYLAVLHFHVLGSLGTNSDITLSEGALSSNQAEEIAAAWIGDSVEVAVIPGDANGNGIVNAVDITKVERIIAGLDTPTPGADANLNGNINAVDITKIERIIAGLP